MSPFDAPLAYAASDAQSPVHLQPAIPKCTSEMNALCTALPLSAHSCYACATGRTLPLIVTKKASLAIYATQLSPHLISTVQGVCGNLLPVSAASLSEPQRMNVVYEWNNGMW